MTVPYRAVLADDVADLRYLYRLVLEGTGRFDVVAEAGDGLAAVDLVTQHLPDLVLLDVSMPGLDGLEALPRMRRASPRSRIVMLTGFAADRLAETAMDLGAAAYLEKGVTPDRLLAELLAVLGDSAAATTAASDDGAGDAQVEAPAPPTLGAEELVSVVAHEIRNPTAVILGLASVLENAIGALPAAFLQVLVNLVGNAAAHSPPDAPVVVRVDRAPGVGVVEIVDLGPGIPQADRERVFDRFVRLHAGGAGVGLGLFIARSLMRAMGGDVRVGDADTGTRMVCRLPAA